MPDMTETVRKFIGRCPTCAFNKVAPHHGCMHIPPNGNAPWQVVCVDIVHLTPMGDRQGAGKGWDRGGEVRLVGLSGRGLS